MTDNSGTSESKSLHSILREGSFRALQVRASRQSDLRPLGDSSIVSNKASERLGFWRMACILKCALRGREQVEGSRMANSFQGYRVGDSEIRHRVEEEYGVESTDANQEPLEELLFTLGPRVSVSWNCLIDVYACNVRHVTVEMRITQETGRLGAIRKPRTAPRREGKQQVGNYELSSQLQSYDDAAKPSV